MFKPKSDMMSLRLKRICLVVGPRMSYSKIRGTAVKQEMVPVAQGEVTGPGSGARGGG